MPDPVATAATVTESRAAFRRRYIAEETANFRAALERSVVSETCHLADLLGQPERHGWCWGAHNPTCSPRGCLCRCHDRQEGPRGA